MSALDNCFRGYGYTWNWLSHCDDDASISHNNENRTSLLTSPPFKGYREKSIASGKRKETQEPRWGEGKWELFVSSAPPPPPGFAAHSRVRFPLEVAPTKKCYKSYYGLVVRVPYSVSQLTLGTPMKNLSFLHTKKRPLWLHVSFLTHFNQPLTINNIAALTRAWHKKIFTYEWYNDAQVYTPIASCCYLISRFWRESTWPHTRAFKNNLSVLGLTLSGKG